MTMKYKIFYLLALIILVQNARAKTIVMCWPSQRDTRFVVDDENSRNKFGFYLTNPIGYDYMPQFQGPASAASLSFQKMQYEDLKSIGSSFKVIWDADQCKYVENFNFICNGEVATSDSSIKAVSLSTTLIEERTNDQLFRKVRYKFGLLKNGNTYFVTLEYPQERCQKY